MIRLHLIDCVAEKESGVDYDKIQKVCEDGKLLPHITFFGQKNYDDSNAKWPQDVPYQGIVEHNAFLKFTEEVTLNKVKIIDSQR